MSQKRRSYETEKLFELISVIVNQKEIPQMRTVPMWDMIYKAADYHNLANILYYATICMTSKKEEGWKHKFEEVFHKSVRSAERYSAAMPQLLKLFEEERIHCLPLEDYIMRSFYPQEDMSFIKNIDILVEKGNEEKIEKILKKYDYEKRIHDVEGESVYYKIPGIMITLKTSLVFLSKKSDKMLNIKLRDYPLEEGHKYLHTFLPEKYYTYVIAKAAEEFAKGDLEIKEILDIWCYYKKSYSELDFDKINKDLSALELEKFQVILIQLAAFWFGDMTFPESDIVFETLEEYIFSKGVNNREDAAKILPLIKDAEEVYAKRIEERRKKQKLEWVFPPIEYMDGMFPMLKKAPWLIYVCWVIRLFRIAMRTTKKYISIKITLIKEKLTPTFLKIKDNLQKLNIKVKIICSKIIVPIVKVKTSITSGLSSFAKKIKNALNTRKNT